MRLPKLAMVLVVALGGLALWLPVAEAATLKDNFASRETVKAVPVDAIGSNVGASREAGEPVPTAISAAGHSVWFGWEAPSSQYVTASTCDSAIPTVLATYAGTELSKLSELNSRANFGGPECSGVRNGITFLALTGSKVQVLVDGNNFFVPPALPPATEGPLALRIEATPPPPNDNFGAAEPVGGTISEEPDGARFYFADVFGYNWNATKETGEPKHAGDSGGSSVWYTWTAPESGVARISLCCGTVNLLGVYVGNAVSALSEVGSGKGSVEVPVTAGTTYRIAVDSEFSFFLGGTFDDSFDLKVAMNLAPGTPHGGSPSGGGSSGAADMTPPDTFIFYRRRRPASPTTRVFDFRASESRATFVCSRDARPFTACASPKTYQALKPGRHRFEVAAVDAASNKDPTPAKAQFRISKPKPRSGKAKG